MLSALRQPVSLVRCTERDTYDGMPSDRYDVLEAYVSLFQSLGNQDIMFMDDNVNIHIHADFTSFDFFFTKGYSPYKLGFDVFGTKSYETCLQWCRNTKT